MNPIENIFSQDAWVERNVYGIRYTNGNSSPQGESIEISTLSSPRFNKVEASEPARAVEKVNGPAGTGDDRDHLFPASRPPKNEELTLSWSTRGSRGLFRPLFAEVLINRTALGRSTDLSLPSTAVVALLSLRIRSRRRYDPFPRVSMKEAWIFHFANLRKERIKNGKNMQRYYLLSLQYK